MAGELLSSKIVVQEEEPQIPALPTIQTAVLGAVGKAVKGPLNVATLVTSFEEYARTFGTFRLGFDLPIAIRDFFLQGGRTGWIVRAGSGGVAALKTLISGLASSGSILSSVAAPYDLEPSTDETLIIKIDGVPQPTVTFTATAGLVESGNAAPFALADADVLTVKVDAGAVQTVTFNAADFASIAAATAVEVAAVINAQLSGATATVTSAGTKVTITSNKRGSSSAIQVTGGTANAAGKLNFSTVAVLGTGNVANIDAVTANEVVLAINTAIAGGVASVEGSKVRITSNTTGATSTVQVDSTSTADDEIGFDNSIHSGTAAGANVLTLTATSVGTWGNAVKIFIKNATSGIASEFNLDVEVDGFIVERFANLNVFDSTSPRYASTVINDSKVGSLNVTASVLGTARPANNSNGAFLAGGTEPTISDVELIGDTVPSPTGIRALDEIEDVTLLVIPDGSTIATQNAMTTYAEITTNRRIMAILDPPAGLTAQDIAAHAESLTASEQWALYWPRVKIPNPSPRIFGTDIDTIVGPISGHITGVISRNDANLQVGPFANPANTEDGRLFGVVDLETTEVQREEKRDLIFPKRVNPVVFMRGQGFFADGARTGLGTSNFPSIGERRGVSAVEQTAKRALQFAKNKINTPELRDRVERVLISVIMPFVKAGALASKDPSKAFFVDVSDQLNTPSVITAGKLLARIGLATAKPAEFIILLVTQDTRALQEELLSAAL